MSGETTTPQIDAMGSWLAYHREHGDVQGKPDYLHCLKCDATFWFPKAPPETTPAPEVARLIERLRLAHSGCAEDGAFMESDPAPCPWGGTWNDTPKLFLEAAEALAVLRQERTQLQGLVKDWREHTFPPHHQFIANSFQFCADQLHAVLSGSVVSPEAQDQ